MEVSTVLCGIVTNREATYVLVFVEDVERFDGRHVVGTVVEQSSLRLPAKVFRYTPESPKRLSRRVCCLSVNISRS